MSLVLDCSVAMSWCFEDEVSAFGDRVLNALEEGEAFVPSVWPLEVSNVLVVAERRARLKVGDSARFLEQLLSLPIFVEEVFLPLATHDLALAKAADSVGVPRF